MISVVSVLSRASPVGTLTTFNQFTPLVAQTTRTFATAKAPLKGKAAPPKSSPKGKPAAKSVAKSATPVKAAKVVKGTPVKGTPVKGTPVKGSSAKATEVKTKESVIAKNQREREREKLQLQKEKEKARLHAAKEKERAAKEKEREQALKQREKEKSKLAAAKEKERLEKEKDKEIIQKQKEKEKQQKAKEKELEAAQKDKEKAKKLKAAEKEKEESKKAKEREERERKKKEKEERPKRALSAYMFFASDIRASVVQKNPDLKLTEVVQEIGKKWGTLTPEQKKKYEELASQDKDRAVKERQAYEDAHPKAPKRPISAFLAFVKDTRVKVTQQNPQITQTEVLRLVATKWKALSPEQKKPYEKQALAAKDRYTKDKKAFEENMAR